MEGEGDGEMTAELDAEGKVWGVDVATAAAETFVSAEVAKLKTAEWRSRPNVEVADRLAQVKSGETQLQSSGSGVVPTLNNRNTGRGQ